jgi:hypothetical protein
MLKNILHLLPILILGGLASWFFPWWSIAIVCFGVGAWLNDSPGKSYALGMAAVTLLWSGYAGFLNNANGGLLASKISELFKGKVSGTQLIFVSGLIGGLVGGFATMTGAYFRQLIVKAK